MGRLLPIGANPKKGAKLRSILLEAQSSGATRMIRNVGLFLLAATTSAFTQTPCEKLRSFTAPGATITEAEFVPAGTLPAHCRVAAVLAPSADSHIEMEVWLPTP